MAYEQGKFNFFYLCPMVHKPKDLFSIYKIVRVLLGSVFRKVRLFFFSLLYSFRSSMGHVFLTMALGQFGGLFFVVFCRTVC